MMSKTIKTPHDMHLLGMYEQTCGEMPPAELLDPETSRLFIRQMSRRHGRKKCCGPKKRR